MEHIIANLVQEFEKGKIDRRQLIRSLAIAASVAASAPAQAAEGGVLKATRIRHLSYRVADYAKSRDFYVGLFGMKVSDDRGTRCNLTVGESDIVITTTTSGVVPRVDHLSYYIDASKSDAIAEFTRRGLNPAPEADGIRIHDPDGFPVDLTARG